MAEALAEIQRACFPTLSQEELITAEQFRAHIRAFPAGQHVVLNKDGVPVASSTDLITNMDFEHPEHRYMELTGNNWLTTHNPKGEWLYGCDIGVHPDYQGLGLSRMLYAARRALVKRLDLKGHVAGGMLKGYHKYKNAMDVRTYVDKVSRGELTDPVLSVQLKQGFKVAAIINHYLDDPSCDNKAALIVWHNEEHKP
jgi:GNAT superfamily N-acetyltransferase